MWAAYRSMSVALCSSFHVVKTILLFVISKIMLNPSMRPCSYTFAGMRSNRHISILNRIYTILFCRIGFFCNTMLEKQTAGAEIRVYKFKYRQDIKFLVDLKNKTSTANIVISLGRYLKETSSGCTTDR